MKGWYPNPWATTWRQRGNGWSFLIEKVAGFDPVRVREIRTSCSYLDVSRCYASMCADSEGYAWHEQG